MNGLIAVYQINVDGFEQLNSVKTGVYHFTVFESLQKSID